MKSGEIVRVWDYDGGMKSKREYIGPTEQGYHAVWSHKKDYVVFWNHAEPIEPERCPVCLSFRRNQSDLANSDGYCDHEWHDEITHETFEEQIGNLVKIQGSRGNWDYDEYMRGMYNGMELCYAIIQGREPEYRDALPKPIEPERCPECGWVEDGIPHTCTIHEITHPTIMDRTLWWEDNFCWGTVLECHKYGDGYRTSHAGWKPKSWFQGRAHTKTPPEAKGEEVTG